MNNENNPVSKKGKIEEKYDYEVILLNGMREKGKVLKRENGEWEIKANRKRKRKSPEGNSNNRNKKVYGKGVK